MHRRIKNLPPPRLEMLGFWIHHPPYTTVRLGHSPDRLGSAGTTFRSRHFNSILHTDIQPIYMTSARQLSGCALRALLRILTNICSNYSIKKTHMKPP